MKRLIRFCHQLYAKLNGYFWIPCELCGDYFGGHEDGKEQRCGRLVKEVITTDGIMWPSMMSLVCPNCKTRAIELNKSKGLPYEDLRGWIICTRI